MSAYDSARIAVAYRESLGMLPTAKRPSAETAVKLQYPGHETATLRQFREEVLRRFRFGWFGRL